ncbi:MAG: TRAP transporter small permease [Thermoleophilia bacterium]|nr:TRAP transporter small permease [Thermoleophilia bacterium]
MPDDKESVVAPDESILLNSEELGPEGQQVWRPVRVTATILRTCQILGMALVVFLMFLTVAHVVGRYVFDFPMLGVVEVSGLIVVTLVFCAGPYDFVIGRHIAVDVVVRRLPRTVALIVNYLTYLISLVMVVLALIWTIKQGIKISGSGARTDMLHIPLYPFYFVVAFGWLLSAVAICARLFLFVLNGRPTGGVPEAVAEGAAVETIGKAVEE